MIAYCPVQTVDGTQRIRQMGLWMPVMGHTLEGHTGCSCVECGDDVIPVGYVNAHLLTDEEWEDPAIVARVHPFVIDMIEGRI